MSVIIDWQGVILSRTILIVILILRACDLIMDVEEGRERKEDKEDREGLRAEQLLKSTLNLLSGTRSDLS